MWIKRLAPAFTACLLLCSCKQTGETTYIIDFAFASPKPGWTYYADNKILLAVTIDTQEITWESSEDGYLGQGNHLLTFLSPGPHTLTAQVRGAAKTGQVYIRQRETSGQGDKTLVNYAPLEKLLPPGDYYPAVFTLDGTVTGFITEQTAKSKALQKTLRAEDGYPLRDIRLAAPKAAGMPVRSGAARTANKPNPAIGDKRQFLVVHTISQYAAPHELEAELFYLSDTIAVWIPASAAVPQAALQKCIEAVERVVLPRVEILWGKAADIDGDGRLAILASPTINEEKAAVGFFNPADFFRRDANPASDTYNPASNEMDVIYIAVPDESNGASYSAGSIIATIAHELTHAVTFTRKTWEPRLNGEPDAAREELFLDEGWSHLSENLCGYGVSGGNIQFLRRFFEDTALYSFCGPNRLGQEDSAGMRGAITLFLSWLFWKKGGLSWDDSDPVTLIDQGGIAFLREMIASKDTGWKNIGNASGAPTDQLFEEMIMELNACRISGAGYQYRSDAVTGEPVEFFANMGAIGNTDIVVGFPRAYESAAGTTAGPWSFMLFEPFATETETLLTISMKEQDGAVYYVTDKR
jgi:hypothetical protein